MKRINLNQIKFSIQLANLTQNQRYAIEADGGEGNIIAETEKAVKVEFVTDFGTIRSWFPKSCIKSEEEVKKEILDAYNKQQERLNAYFEFVERAKALGVKGIRKYMKKQTIIKIANAQGIAL